MHAAVCALSASALPCGSVPVFYLVVLAFVPLLTLLLRTGRGRSPWCRVPFWPAAAAFDSISFCLLPLQTARVGSCQLRSSSGLIPGVIGVGLRAPT